MEGVRCEGRSKLATQQHCCCALAAAGNIPSCKMLMIWGGEADAAPKQHSTASGQTLGVASRMLDIFGVTFLATMLTVL